MSQFSYTSLPGVRRPLVSDRDLNDNLGIIRVRLYSANAWSGEHLERFELTTANEYVN